MVAFLLLYSPMKRLVLLLLISSQGFSQQASELPLVFIDTQGRTIRDEPKTEALIQIIDNGEGKVNKSGDTPVFVEKIGIEYRGSSSQMFPKKPYGFETWDDKGEDLDVSLFGWPEESDWILFASYNEKSLIHNVLAMRIAREMGLYASRTKYVELYVNKDYQGVYVLLEKVKRDKGRVDIAKLDPEEESGDDLTGGYILKIDKNTGTNIGSFFSDYTNVGSGFKPTEFLYEYPDPPTLKQQEYIRDYVKRFEKSLMQNQFVSAADNYRDYIDMKSFVFVTLLNEITKNVDAYRISTFLYKDKDSNDGKLTLGPPWDYDLSFGNANYCEGQFTNGFAYRFNYVCPGDNWFVPFWWDRFLSDPTFVELMRQTYDDLRTNGVLQEAELMKIIDQYASEIEKAQLRNFNKWPVLGMYVWPQPSPYATTWWEEVNELKFWLSARLRWLDANLPGSTNEVLATMPKAEEIQVYPNPFTETISVKIQISVKSNVNIDLINALGQVVHSENQTLQAGNQVVYLEIDEKAKSEHIYALRVRYEGKEELFKLVKN